MNNKKSKINNKKSKINIKKNNLIKQNEHLKEMIKKLNLELKLVKEKNNLQLSVAKEEAEIETQDNEGIIIHGIKSLHDNCFNLPCVFIRFHERNIRLKLNHKRSFGTTYTYSGFFNNYNIGLNSKKIINKKYKKFNLNIFFYFNRKDSHLYVSSEGSIRKEKNIIEYIFFTENNNKHFKKYKYVEGETFNWPIIHNLKIKDINSNEEEEVKIKIMKSNQIHKKKPKS